MLDRGEPAAVARRRGRRAAAVAPRPLYAGCALPQDREAHALTRKVARDLGLPLVEAGEAGCCGHPTRGQAAAKYAQRRRRPHGLPGLRPGACATRGLTTTPLWQALVEHAESERSHAARGAARLRALRRLPERARPAR